MTQRVDPQAQKAKPHPEGRILSPEHGTMSHRGRDYYWTGFRFWHCITIGKHIPLCAFIFPALKRMDRSIICHVFWPLGGVSEGVKGLLWWGQSGSACPCSWPRGPRAGRLSVLLPVCAQPHAGKGPSPPPLWASGWFPKLGWDEGPAGEERTIQATWSLEKTEKEGAGSGEMLPTCPGEQKAGRRGGPEGGQAVCVRARGGGLLPRRRGQGHRFLFFGFCQVELERQP